MSTLTDAYVWDGRADLLCNEGLINAASLAGPCAILPRYREDELEMFWVGGCKGLQLVQKGCVCLSP